MSFLSFSDTLELFHIEPNGRTTAVPLAKRGIAWYTDRTVKFRNPVGDNLSEVFKGELFKEHCSSFLDVK